MARTVADVLGRARLLLQDSVPPYRYPDTMLLEFLDLALLEARRVRPDLYLGRLRKEVPVVTTGTVFPLPEAFIPPCVAYVAGMCDLIEEESVAEGRATALIGRFTSQLLSPG
jgi:hypothetical protein